MNQLYGAPTSKFTAAQIWSVALVVWLLGLCLLPDTNPLSSPAWATDAAKSIFSISEAKARVFSAIVLRAIGLSMIGILLSMALSELPLQRAAKYVLISAPLLALFVKCVNYGYFPIRMQLAFILAVSIFGALVGLACRKSRLAAVLATVLAVAIIAWGTATRAPANLEMAARITGFHIIDHADQIGSGDEAYLQMIQMAFSFAEENSQGTDAILPNKAAILALGVIMGDDNVALVGGSELDSMYKDQRAALRQRITIHGRSDLPKHFAVSAALTVLSDEQRALAVGIAKELSDSQGSGSGFSFVDMVANKSGIRFAVVGTKSQASAKMFQQKIANAESPLTFMPEISELPEGLPSQVFETAFGGIGGERTRSLFKEIDQRVANCPGLKFDLQ
jgi:hypothetical protein